MTKTQFDNVNEPRRRNAGDREFRRENAKFDTHTSNYLYSHYARENIQLLAWSVLMKAAPNQHIMIIHVNRIRKRAKCDPFSERFVPFLNSLCRISFLYYIFFWEGCQKKYT